MSISEPVKKPPARSVLELLHRAPGPRFALWEITQRCPADCVHCYLGERDDHNDLGLADCMTILDKLRQAGVLFLTLTGGEATVHKHFFEVLEGARERNFAVGLFTAAYHLRPRQVQRIIDANLLKVEVSVLGLGETHDRLTRRPGSFERMIANVKAFRAGGLYVVLKTTMMPENAHQIVRIKEMAESLGCAYKFSAQILSRTDNHERQPLGELTWAERLETLAEVEREMLESGFRHTPEEAIMCGAGRTAWSLSPGGDVFPCNVLRIPCGNLVEQPWEEVWNAEPMRGVREYNTAQVTGCQGCGVISNCKRCPGQAYMETGDYRAPSRVDCEIASLRAEIRGDAVTRPFPNSDIGPDSSIVMRLPVLQKVS